METVGELLGAVAENVFKQVRIEPAASGTYFIRYQVGDRVVDLNACRHAERWTRSRWFERDLVRLFVDVEDLDGDPAEEGEDPDSVFSVHEFTVSEWIHAADHISALIKLLRTRQANKLDDLASELAESVNRCVD